MLHSVGVRVENRYLASRTQQVDEIASIAAASIEDAHFGGDVSTEDLIEDVDVDLSKLLLDGQRHTLTILLWSYGSSTVADIDPLIRRKGAEGLQGWERR